MIEQLHERTICDEYGNAYGVSAPDLFEMMEKINEIIDVINKITKEE